MRAAVTSLTAAVAVAVTAPGAAANAPSASGSACLDATAVASALGEHAPRPGALQLRRFTQPDGARACRVTADSVRLSLVVGIDTQPQAQFRLDKQVTEYGQGVIWFHQGDAAYPQYIAHLGVEADWLPAADELLETDGARLIMILVERTPAADGPRRAIAVALGRSYLAHPDAGRG
jgi:hypothetical protein